MKRIHDFKGYYTSVSFCEISKNFIQSKETHPFLVARQVEVAESSGVEDRHHPPHCGNARPSMLSDTERPGPIHTETPLLLDPNPGVRSLRRRAKTSASANSKGYLKKAIP